MKKRLVVLIISLIFFQNVFCEELNDSISIARKEPISTSLGAIGLGLDYGGLGVQVTKIFKPVAFYFGFGYNQTRLSPVGGVKLMHNQTGIFIPYIKLMYGYNGVLLVENKARDISYGFTPGIGFQVVISKESSTGISVDFNVPIRQKSFMNTYHELLKSNYYQSVNDLSPVLVSLGFFTNFGQR